MRSPIITHKESGYSKPTEIIAQYNWTYVGEIGFYGFVTLWDVSAIDQINRDGISENIVALFKIKWK